MSSTPHVMTFGYRLSKGTAAQAEWKARLATVDAVNGMTPMLEAHMYLRGSETELQTIYMTPAESREAAIATAYGYLQQDPHHDDGTPSPWGRVVVYFGLIDPSATIHNLSRHGTPIADLRRAD